jgi:hypothetical protein
MKRHDCKIPGKIDIPGILLDNYSLLMVASEQQERQKVAANQKYLTGMLFTTMNVATSFVGCFI